MSTDYATIVDRVVALLAAERLDKLSEDLSGDVVAVKKGQYVPGSSAEKPVLYVRFVRSGLIGEMAGGMSRQERLMVGISGAVVADDQETAHDDATNLINNIEAVLANYPTDSGHWGGSYFGWNFEISDTNPEEFAFLSPEPGAAVAVYHFQVLWSCDVRIGTDAL
jgi:hypothetical protein